MSDLREGFATLPKYQMIADEMRIHIQDGKYADAHVLPTEYSISEEYHVSRQTVRQALSVLADEGLIDRRQGSGSYINRRVSVQESTSAKNIAVITTYISDYIFPSILREVENVLAHNNYTPSLFATQNQVSNERRILTGLLQGAPVDGILVEGTKTALPNPNQDLYLQLMDKGIPIVFMNGNYANLHGALSVLDDNCGGGRMLVEYLHGKGHTNIAGIFKSDDIQGHQRYSGYISALRDLQLPMEGSFLFWYDTENKQDFFTRHLPDVAESIMKDCTAVVCYNDEVARCLVGHLIKTGIKIPQEMAVVSFDNSQYSEFYPIRITSLSHETENVGRLAAELLIRLISGESGHSQLASWTLIEKESS